MVDRICKDGAGEKSIVKGLDFYMFTLASSDQNIHLKEISERKCFSICF